MQPTAFARLMLGHCVAASASLAVLSAASAQGALPSLQDLVAQRDSLLVGLRDASHEERQGAAAQFLRSVSWDQICYLCEENSPGASAAEMQLLRNFVRGRLNVAPPAAEELAWLLRHPLMREGCQQEIVQYVSHARAQYRGTEDGEVLARAFLDLADSGVRPPGINRRLEVAAAYLWADPSLMARMMEYCWDPDPQRVLHGVTMLEGSLDPASGDSLLAVVEVRGDTIDDPKVQAVLMKATAIRAGAKAYDALHRFYAALADANFEESTTQSAPESSAVSALAYPGGGLSAYALEALVRTGDRRALELLLDAYGDRTTGIADTTSSRHDPDRRSRYYQLWFLVRLAEPRLMRLLAEGDQDDVDLAIELLDRESRFGVPAARDTLYQAMESAARRAATPAAERLESILQRFRAHPDPRAIPPPAAPGGGEP